MTMDQLGLFAASDDDPRIAELLRILDRRGWLSAAQIGQATGWTDRTVRQIASASPKILSYPGSPGYKLTAQATAEERDAAVGHLHSQGRRMIERAIAISREHRFGATTVDHFCPSSGYGDGA